MSDKKSPEPSLNCDANNIIPSYTVDLNSSSILKSYRSSLYDSSKNDFLVNDGNTKLL
jgi:hypothetical protein